MTGIEPCLGSLGGLYKDLEDPPAAPASAHSALNGDLRAKAPLGFVSTSSLEFTCKNIFMGGCWG